MKIYCIAQKDREQLNAEERTELKNCFEDIQCSFAKDKDGYYCYTHRARSESYPLISDIPKSTVDFINSTGAVKDAIIKLAVSDGEFRDFKDKISSIKNDIRELNKDSKDFESRLKKIEKTIDSLNIGNRMFSEAKNIFTSLQRKVERLEATSYEWKNYKKEMDADVKKMVEKHTKARISDIAPKAY